MNLKQYFYGVLKEGMEEQLEREMMKKSEEKPQEAKSLDISMGQDDVVVDIKNVPLCVTISRDK